MTTSIEVSTRHGPYQILVGNRLLGQLGRLLDSYAPAHRYALISDATVAALYGREALAALGGEPHCQLFSFPPGEANKTRDTWAALTDRMLEAGFGRDCAVVAVGGGVTGDLAGFVAATIHRGVPCVQVPTSLLAMIDSSVGGKTGIDTVHGKNLVGAFHQPSVVIVDGSTLDTLPNRHISAGAAEALKHGAIADAEYFDWIVANSDAILSRDRETLLSLVQRSIAIKAGVVSDDETEQGRRAVLNFGHTVGHALETVMDFSLLHGEAVAIGMLAEADLGIRMGITGACAAASLRTALDALQLPTRPRIGAAAHRLMAAMEKDKKVRHGSVRFTLLERIGQVHQSASGEWTHHVTESVILDALKMLL